MNRRFWIGALFLFVTAVSAGGEEAPTVQSRAWPTQATVGDEIKLILQVIHPKGYVLNPPFPQTNVAPFEIKSVRPLPPIPKGRFVQDGFEFMVTVFRMGDTMIPPIRLTYQDASGRSGEVWSSPVPVKIVSVLKGGKAEEIRPIKNVISLGLREVWSLLGAIAALILAVALAVKIYLRKRKRPITDPESLLPAHERALLELEHLQKKGYLDAGRVKDYYSELSAILRRYFERRYRMEALELTTSEIMRDLRERDFDGGVRERAKEVLENSDLVKFANFSPPKSAADKLVRNLAELVEITKPVPEEAKP